MSNINPSAEQLAAQLRAQGGPAAEAVELVLSLLEQGYADDVIAAITHEQERRALVARFATATARWSLANLRGYVEAAELSSKIGQARA